MPKLRKKINYSILIKNNNNKKTQQPRALQLVLRVLPGSNPATKKRNPTTKNSNLDHNNTNEKKKKEKKRKRKKEIETKHKHRPR